MPLKPLPLFGYHPMIQSFAFLLLLQSILTLQPTSQEDPTAKRKAFTVHRAFNLALVLPLFTAGASIMWYLHDQPGQKHFVSWHGILGTAVIVWTWLQVAAGVAATSFDGKLVGGMQRAKSLWKWHRYVNWSTSLFTFTDNTPSIRLSGYVLLPAFAFVLYLGAAHTTWSQQNANITHHILVLATLICSLVAIFMRMNRSKLPAFRTVM